MNFVKSTLAIAAVSVGFIATGASAQEPSTADCIKAAHEVSQAIKANQNSANLRAAKAEQSAGQHFCMSALYGRGVEHYKAALDLLGQK
jgi:hypothetical protein